MLFAPNFFINTSTISLTPNIKNAAASDILGQSDGEDDSPEDDSSPPGGGRGEDEDDDPRDSLAARERDDEDPPGEDDTDQDNGDDDKDDRGLEGVLVDEKEDQPEQEDEERAEEEICAVTLQDEEEDGDEVGTLTIKKVFANTGKLIPDGVFRIIPNPYTLDDSLIIHDNDNGSVIDCSPRKGVIILADVHFSTYNIQEVRERSSSPTVTSLDYIVLHEADMYIHENLVNPVINFVESNFNNIISEADNIKQLTIPNQYIVALNDRIEGQDLESIANEFKNKGAKLLHTFDSMFKGFAVNLEENKELLGEIKNDSRVAFIEQDKMGHVASVESETALNKKLETMPRGIDRIDADLNSIFSFNDNKTVLQNPNINDTDNISEQDEQNIQASRLDEMDIAILDTGISLVHPDLNVYNDISFLNGMDSGDDDQGHGSHMAGTAAGKDNSLGMVGIAPGARLWAVKVCDRLSNCPVSSQIKGVEYVTEHSDEIDIANISIENPLSYMLDAAINQSVVEGGVTYVVAAGNSGNNASLYSPSSNPSVITVSAINDSDGKCGGIGRPTFIGQDDSFANFSNFGPAIDIAAPGVDIFSTYNGTEYGVASGTSTAAPHVTGVAALYKSAHPLSSPAEIYDVLESSASLPSTQCDGNGHGYFKKDIDGVEEPLLYVNKSN
ncbi:MAG: S8 family serine peptidase [Nitrososphaeraceae archaeon]